MNKPNHLNLGARVPQVSFRTRSENDWLDVSSSEIFDGKTVAVYALPGAFTPTCSSTHLPGDPFEVSDAMTMLEAMGNPADQSD